MLFLKIYIFKKNNKMMGKPERVCYCCIMNRSKLLSCPRKFICSCINEFLIGILIAWKIYILFCHTFIPRPFWSFIDIHRIVKRTVLFIHTHKIPWRCLKMLTRQLFEYFYDDAARRKYTICCIKYFKFLFPKNSNNIFYYKKYVK